MKNDGNWRLTTNKELEVWSAIINERKKWTNTTAESCAYNEMEDTRVVRASESKKKE